MSVAARARRTPLSKSIPLNPFTSHSLQSSMYVSRFSVLRTSGMPNRLAWRAIYCGRFQRETLSRQKQMERRWGVGKQEEVLTSWFEKTHVVLDPVCLLFSSEFLIHLRYSATWKLQRRISKEKAWPSPSGEAYKYVRSGATQASATALYRRFRKV